MPDLNGDRHGRRDAADGSLALREGVAVSPKIEQSSICNVDNRCLKAAGRAEHTHL